MKNLTLKDYVLISEAEAIEKYGIDTKINALFGVKEAQVAVYNGNLIIDKNFTLEESIKESKLLSGYIIKGNLTVETYILNHELDSGPFLFILGDTKAQNINLGGSEAYFKGNVEVANVIYGRYNHGSIIIDGNVKAKIILSHDYFISLKGKVEALVISDKGSIEGKEADFCEENIKDILLDELIVEGYLDIYKVSDYVNENKNIIKEGKT